MDRNLFLQCQPYLFPLPSTRWPPSTTMDTLESDCRREILLQGSCYLSIEPFSDMAVQSLGPAFFRKAKLEESNRDDDPAMCHFELALLIGKTQGPPSSHDDTGTMCDLPPPITNRSSPKEATGIPEPMLLFYIDGYAYQVDLMQIENVEVEPSSNDDGTTKPPCLLIHFSVCLFRIFCLDGNPADQYSLFGSIKTSIMDILMSGTVQTFPANSLLTSPTRSSENNSSNEPGQKETTNNIYSPGEKTGVIRSENLNEHEFAHRGSFVSVTGKRRKFLNRARRSLETLEKIMALPTRSSACAASDMREQIAMLLNSIPENISASYCTKAEITEALQAHNNTINNQLEELYDMARSFTPSSRGRKRPRPSDELSTQLTPDTHKRPDDDECISKTKDILRMHKEALRSKYSLSLLPNRG